MTSRTQNFALLTLCGVAVVLPSTMPTFAQVSIPRIQISIPQVSIRPVPFHDIRQSVVTRSHPGHAAGPKIGSKEANDWYRNRDRNQNDPKCRLLGECGRNREFSSADKVRVFALTTMQVPRTIEPMAFGDVNATLPPPSQQVLAELASLAADLPDPGKRLTQVASVDTAAAVGAMAAAEPRYNWPMSPEIASTIVYSLAAAESRPAPAPVAASVATVSLQPANAAADSPAAATAPVVVSAERADQPSTIQVSDLQNCASPTAMVTADLLADLQRVPVVVRALAGAVPTLDELSGSPRRQQSGKRIAEPCAPR